MGQKGRIDIDVDSLVDAVLHANIVKMDVKDHIAEINRLQKDLSESGKLQGGKFAQDIQAGCDALRAGTGKISTILEQVSKFIDVLSQDAQEELTKTEAGRAALANAEETMKNMRAEA